MGFRHCEGWVFRPFDDVDDVVLSRKKFKVYNSNGTPPPVILNILVPRELADDNMVLDVAYDCIVHDVEVALDLMNKSSKKWDRRTSSHYFKCMICLVTSRHNIKKGKLQSLSIEVWGKVQDEVPVQARRKRAHLDINDEYNLGPVQPEFVSIIHQINRFYEID